MKNLILPVLLSLATIPVAQAYETKEARKNDIATEYVLDNSGNLMRRLPNHGLCPVARNVKNFKISIHPRDEALIYFTVNNGRRDDLYELKRDDAGYMKCLLPNLEPLMVDVKKYTVVSSTKTDIVNIALDRKGNLKAWGNRDLLLDANGIEEYSMNQCNDQDGRRHARYVAFAETRDGRILKIDGDSPRDWKFTDERFVDRNNRTAIQNFKQRENVCGLQRYGESQQSQEAAEAQPEQRAAAPKLEEPVRQVELKEEVVNVTL